MSSLRQLTQLNDRMSSPPDAGDHSGLASLPQVLPSPAHSPTILILRHSASACSNLFEAIGEPDTY